MNDRLIENGRIEGTMLGREDHGITTCMIHISFDGSGQGFGGYAMDKYEEDLKKRIGTAYGMKFIMGIMEALEVDSWEKLKGVYVRADHDYTKIYRIGHITKNKWFDPQELK